MSRATWLHDLFDYIYFASISLLTPGITHSICIVSGGLCECVCECVCVCVCVYMGGMRTFLQWISHIAFISWHEFSTCVCVCECVCMKHVCVCEECVCVCVCVYMGGMRTFLQWI